jgi:hypothetical protein
MPKIRTFSRTFPSYHPKAGQPTYFVEKFYNSLGVDYRNKAYMLRVLKKNNPEKELWLLRDFIDSLNFGVTEEKKHTIRAGAHFKNDDEIQLAVWSGRPYNSPQIKLIEPLFVACYDFFKDHMYIMPKATPEIHLEIVSNNDG